VKDLLARRWKVGAVIGAVVVIVAALAAGLLLRDEGELEEAGTSVDLTATSTLPEVVGTDPATGGQIDFARVADGRPLMINMWASWCEGCRVEAEDIRRFAEDRPEVAVVGLNVSDERRSARNFVDTFRWEHPSVEDPNAEVAGQIGDQALSGLPTTVYVTADGRVAGRSLGEVTYEQLNDVADELVQESES
jgi:thiol-disulfide isomerase/thioredoxin